MKLCIRLLCGHERTNWLNPSLFVGLTTLLQQLSQRGHVLDVNLLADYSPVEYARNIACQEALNGHADWLLQVDNDQVLPDNLVHLIEAADASPDINIVSVATWMTRRGQSNPVPVVNNWAEITSEGNWCDRPILPDKPGFQEIKNGGAGVMLIRRPVLIKLDAPWFRVLLDKRTCEPRCGEDDFFCRQARESGFRIHTHSGCTAGHLKTVDLRNFAELLRNTNNLPCT